MFDCLIIGGGAAGMSCALLLGSAKERPYTENKKIGIVMHQKGSHMQNALFNNALGLPKATGAELLEKGKQHLTDTYTHIEQIVDEKVIAVTKEGDTFLVETNKGSYSSKIVVVAIGYNKVFTIEGLEQYLEPHKKSRPQEERLQLKNEDHLVAENLYVAGTLAGWRSQYAIACGSGTSVAADILTLWNDGEHAKVHDKV